MSPAPEPASRHARTDVVDAALRVLDELGLPGLSMRRIAEVLDVQVSALYWHFPNKQTLLAAVSERIVGGSDAAARSAGAGAAMPGPVEPSGDLAVIATELRERLLAHRDGAELVSSSLALGLLELPSRARLIAAARGLGLDEDSAAVAADTIVHFVIGYTFHEQQRLHAAVVGAADASADLDPAAVDGAPEVDPFQSALGMITAGARAAAAAR